jgi:hypothetical protein
MEIQNVMMKHSKPRAFLFALVACMFVLGIACTSNKDDDDKTGTGGTSGSNAGSGGSKSDGGSTAGADTSGLAVGTFNIKLVKAEGTAEAHTTVQGSVGDIPPVNSRIIGWKKTPGEGDCELYVPEMPFCDPSCDSGKTCIAGTDESFCSAAETLYDLGTVTVKGLQSSEGTESLELTGVVKKYSLGKNTLLYPPFAEGDAVSIEASGKDIDGFTVSSNGIEPLEVLTSGDITMEKNKPVSIEWTPATMANNSTIEVVIDISHHGGQRGEVRCSTDDTAGSLEIPAALITKLMNLGYAGFPSMDINRVATGSTTTEAGRVDFIISSGETKAIQIPGLASCDESHPCESGKTCGTDAMCK